MLDFRPTIEQQRCIDAHEGAWVTIASPGSGKSSTLVQRHMALLSKGVFEKDILNLTFTSEAAKNMLEKASQGLFTTERVFRTFHSYALDLLTREREHLPFKTTEKIIPVMGESFQLMKDLLKMYPAISSFRALKDRLTEWKNSNTSPEQAMKETYAQGANYFYACAFVDYERKCREQGWLDFESLIKEAVLLLKTNPEVRARNQKKYLSVDECQDTNFTQFELLKLLYTGNIFCVGDENQLVYEFRDAQPGNLSNFSQTFPGAKTLFLGQNFRSTKRIVSFLKKILPTDNGIASHMMSEREDGVDPTFTEYFDDFEEAAGVLSQIKDVRNTAVIARTNRQLHMFQKRCMAQNIKSKIIGKNDLWHRNEIKHLITLAKDRKHDRRSASTVLTELISQNNLAYIYRNSGGLNESDPVENLNDFVKMSGNKGTVSEFLDWLRRLTYAKATDKNPILTLGTTHQMKGREAKHVFVIGLKQGLMPHKDGESLEEKRIWFVACSRACDFLHISYYGNPSEFILEFLPEGG